jgi:23S rRNA (pseudouridine1915-N3)-methyltransferase
MKIVLIYVNAKNSIHDEIIDEYKKRLSRYVDFEEVRLDHGDIKTEGVNILSKIKTGDYVVLLDEIGGQVNSVDFAEFIDNKQNMSIKRLVFVIGGAYGATSEIKEKADYSLSLGKMVWPHEMARLMLIEQIYRAYSILNNSPYHHK